MSETPEDEKVPEWVMELLRHPAHRHGAERCFQCTSRLDFLAAVLREANGLYAYQTDLNAGKAHELLRWARSREAK